MSLATLPFAGAPSVRVRRPESDGRLLVVVQDVFTHIGKVSTKAVARRIDSATDKLERVVRLVTIRERGNDLKLATLTDALDLLIQINVPAARALRHQLIQLGKHVLAGDPDGTVADEIVANKEILDNLPEDQQAIFKELMEPDGQVRVAMVAGRSTPE